MPGILLITWAYKLPTNETTNTAAKGAALHEVLTALGSDVHASSLCCLLFLARQLNNILLLMKQMLMCDSSPSAPSRKRPCLCAIRLGTLTQHMSIFQGDTVHAVLSMVSFLPFYKSCWNVHVITKNIKSSLNVITQLTRRLP
jgi:hypothetical protein